MAQPYIDCARRLAARGLKATDIKEIVCEVAEGTVHRLWEPLADKQQPRNGYAAKFATPYLLATSFVRGGVGLSAFTEAAISDSGVLALASKVKYVIDPQNPYPKNYTGHIRATMKDGGVVEERQPHLRGGAQEPLTRQDVTDKFALNAQHGGWTEAQSDAALKLLAGMDDGRIDILVNNAALRREKTFAEMDYAEWREILDVTLDGAFHCIKACLPALRQSGAGAIVNIGGLSAHTGAKNRAHVVTAKAGIVGFTRALAYDLASDGITVNCVVPGLIGTPRPKDKPEPAHHLVHQTITGARARPEEVAPAG